jgi:release factor glutamine methyltransferase
LATLLEILDKSADFLSSKGIDDGRYEAECLIAHGLNKQRLELYLEFDRPLNDKELADLRALIVERGKRVPLQHLIGQVGFRHIELKTDKRALIPRPDTECIVDIVHKNHSTEKEFSVLEIGVGTGAIILSITDEFQTSKAVGADISPKAIELAKENALLNENESVDFILSDLFTQVDGQYDLIISNPPYIPSKDLEELEAEVKDHDPMLALDGGEDGLDIVRKMLSQVETYLNKEGLLIIEVGYDQCDVLKDLETSPEIDFVGNASDLAGIARFGIWKKN